MSYVTLRDIAEKAGVTVTTVSRALKDKDDIGFATKKRIKEIADRMGYIPDSRASRLRSNSNKTVGVVVTFLDNFFYNRILMGISEALTAGGYTPIIFSNSESIESERNIMKTLAANRVAGSLIVPASDLENDLDYSKYGFPVVTIVRKKQNSGINFFMNDSEKSGTLVARYFVTEGRKNPAYIGVNLPITCNAARLEGFRRYLENNNISLDSSRVILNSTSLAEAYEGTVKLLKRNPEIDSIFVYNDNIAFAVVRALHDMGVKIPDDVRVIGHDDVEEAIYFNPALSTIKVPRFKLGLESAENLLALIEGGKTNINNRVYEPKLIIRES